MREGAWQGVREGDGEGRNGEDSKNYEARREEVI